MFVSVLCLQLVLLSPSGQKMYWCCRVFSLWFSFSKFPECLGSITPFTVHEYLNDIISKHLIWIKQMVAYSVYCLIASVVIEEISSFQMYNKDWLTKKLSVFHLLPPFCLLRKIQQLYPETVSCFHKITHRRHCLRFSLELLSAEKKKKSRSS